MKVKSAKRDIKITGKFIILAGLYKNKSGKDKFQGRRCKMDPHKLPARYNLFLNGSGGMCSKSKLYAYRKF